MEVHHHAHAHGKKNWKTYFWEFAMLFLAVFCGFLAEYQLEHKIENDREKEYIHSMLEDLQTDTLNLSLSIDNFTRQEKSFDTVFLLYSQLAKGYNHSLRTNLDGIIGYKDFFPTDKTMQQLKNSGGMRLIRSKKAADGITTYDFRLKEYDKSLIVLDEMFSKMFDIGFTILDIENLENDKRSMTPQQLEAGSKNYLLKSDPATLGNYYNRIKVYRQLRQIVIRRMVVLKKYATELIVLLNSEYD